MERYNSVVLHRPADCRVSCGRCLETVKNWNIYVCCEWVRFQLWAPGLVWKFSPKCPVWGPRGLLFSGYRTFFQWRKVAGHEVGYSPLSIANAKNKWHSASAPAVCLHSVHSNSCMPSQCAQQQLYAVTVCTATAVSRHSVHSNSFALTI